MKKLLCTILGSAISGLLIAPSAFAGSTSTINTFGVQYNCGNSRTEVNSVINRAGIEGNFTYNLKVDVFSGRTEGMPAGFNAGTAGSFQYGTYGERTTVRQVVNESFAGYSVTSGVTAAASLF